MASSVGLPLFSPTVSPPPSSIPLPRRWKIPTVRATVSAQPLVAAAPDDLVASILSKVKGTDGGIALSNDGHKEVSNVADQLAGYCVDEPVKSPLIFGATGFATVYRSCPSTSQAGGRLGL